MYRIQVVIFACAFAVIFVTASSAASSAQSRQRIKRASSDQRIAELQALIALSRGRSSLVGYGELDPRIVGKRNQASKKSSDAAKAQKLYQAKQIIRRLFEDVMNQ
ncbi:uncharacterized protein LOC141913079 [Tubulanus polymorphus]|uniref:uncharacterized protein LOC141913079 n=1 Tax=Tubulanus polymorphus TaxID=672921 RepID=UPI003DA5E4DC